VAHPGREFSARLFFHRPRSWPGAYPKIMRSGSIRAQIARDQSIGDEPAFLEEFAHQFERDTLVSLGLDQHVEDLALGVDSAPQIDRAEILRGRQRPTSRYRYHIWMNSYRDNSRTVEVISPAHDGARGARSTQLQLRTGTTSIPVVGSSVPGQRIRSFRRHL
jgi:hypothetical protein